MTTNYPVKSAGGGAAAPAALPMIADHADADDGHGQLAAANASGEAGWAAANRAHRKEAMAWLQQASSTRLVFMRKVLTPMATNGTLVSACLGSLVELHAPEL